MTEISFENLLTVAAIAFLAPLTLGLAPRLRLPAVVLEIVAGIVVGPSGLGWVEIDEPVTVLAMLGLAMLLFLSGLEVDLDRLRGPLLRAALLGFGVSFGIALLVGLGLDAAGLVGDPVFVAIALSATSLGVVIPVLKDADLAKSDFGQLVIAAASIADVATIVLLSLLFSRETGGTGATVLLLGALATVGAVVAGLVLLGERSGRLSGTLLRLQDTTAQIRVRGAFLLLVGFAALAGSLGLEVILGAFVAGLLFSALDPDRAMTHPLLRTKLEAIGFGVLVPAFFVTSGLRFDLGALTGSSSALALVPLLLAALLLVRGTPVLVARGSLGDARHAGAAALLQATSLPFIVAATMIGQEIGVLSASTSAALVAAGLASVLLFPSAALSLLGGAAWPQPGATADAAGPLAPLRTPTPGRA
jgi:Kef-type K+ transport system membrane component KefB